jgi:hypothetical protein
MRLGGPLGYFGYLEKRTVMSPGAVHLNYKFLRCLALSLVTIVNYPLFKYSNKYTQEVFAILVGGSFLMFWDSLSIPS